MQALPHDSKPEPLTMVLSRVLLGHPAYFSSTDVNSLRKPPSGFQSTITLVLSTGHQITCLYDNAQAYPEYVITYEAVSNQGPH